MMHTEDFIDGVAIYKDGVEVAFYNTITKRIRIESYEMPVNDLSEMTRLIENYIKYRDL